jgi:hypothetical protein
MSAGLKETTRLGESMFPRYTHRETRAERRLNANRGVFDKRFPTKQVARSNPYPLLISERECNVAHEHNHQAIPPNHSRRDGPEAEKSFMSSMLRYGVD